METEAMRYRVMVGLFFPLVTLTLFLTLFGLTAGNAILTGSGLTSARDNTFLAGVFAIMAGLFVASSWLGEKEDYSRTAYVTTGPGTMERGSSGPRLFPRTSPGPQPSERQRQNRKYNGALANLLGVSVLLTGILLIIASAFLG